MCFWKCIINIIHQMHGYQRAWERPSDFGKDIHNTFEKSSVHLHADNCSGKNKNRHLIGYPDICTIVLWKYIINIIHQMHGYQKAWERPSDFGKEVISITHLKSHLSTCMLITAVGKTKTDM